MSRHLDPRRLSPLRGSRHSTRPGYRTRVAVDSELMVKVPSQSAPGYRSPQLHTRARNSATSLRRERRPGHGHGIDEALSAAGSSIRGRVLTNRTASPAPRLKRRVRHSKSAGKQRAPCPRFFSPPPLAGEGWGGGTLHGTKLRTRPLPDPPPQAGEGKRESGTRNVRGDIQYAQRYPSYQDATAGRRPCGRRR
jgi:hypothetical protein